MATFPLDAKKITRYYTTTALLLGVGIIGGVVMPSLLILAIVFLTGGAPEGAVNFASLALAGALLLNIIIIITLRRLARRQAEALSYWLEGDTLHLRHGIFFRKHQAIPLNQIGDITLAQGPLLRRYGLWAVVIQTGDAVITESVMHGLVDPAGARDALLAARRDAAAILSPDLPSKHLIESL